MACTTYSTPAARINWSLGMHRQLCVCMRVCVSQGVGKKEAQEQFRTTAVTETENYVKLIKSTQNNADQCTNIKKNLQTAFKNH